MTTYKQPSLPVFVCVLCLASFFLVGMPTIAQAQENSRSDKGDERAPRVLEHNGKQIGAYIKEKTGTPSWILDVDELDFMLGSKQALSTSEQVAEAARLFLEAHAEVFRIHPKNLELVRMIVSLTCCKRA